MTETSAIRPLEFAALYELALSIGRATDVGANVESFLSRLMARTSLAAASIWLLPCGREGGQARLSRCMPAARIRVDALPLDHPQFSLARHGPRRVEAGSPEFEAVRIEEGVTTGVYELLPLGHVGLLKLYAARAERLPPALVRQLGPVIDKLTVTLEGAVAHQRLEALAQEQAAVLAAVPDPVFKVDASGRLRWHNAALTAAMPGTGLGGSIELGGALEAALTAGEARIPALPLTPGNGRLYDVRAVRVADAGAAPAVVVAARDVTEREATLADVRERAKRMGETLAGVGEGLWEWDVAADRIAYSAQWFALLGYPAQATTGSLDVWLELCHPDDAEGALSNMRRSIAARIVNFDNAFRMRHRDGHYVDILSRGVIEFEPGPTGHVRRISGTHQDISAQREYERRIERTVSLLQATLESTGDALLVADADGRLAAVNRPIASLLRAPLPAEGEPVGPILDALAAQLAEPARFTAECAALAGQPAAEQLGLWPLADGRMLECHTRPHRTQGRITGRVWRFADVTARIAAQEALAEEQTLLRSIIDAIPDILFVKDRDGLYTAGNEALFRVVGRSEAEVIGRSDFDLFPRERAERFRIIDADLLAREGPRRIEEQVVYPDGRMAYVETLKTPFYGPKGELRGLIGVARDITARVEDERLRGQLESQVRQAQKMEAIGQLTGGLAHDFNNILSVILGNSGLGLDETSDRPAGVLHIYFEEIRASAARARELVAKMLAFSRHRPVSRLAPLDPVQGVSDALRMLRPTLPTSLTLAVEVDPAAPAFLGDAVELHQVITNLVINARDAVSEHGHIRVRVASTHVPELRCASCGQRFGGRFSLIEVTDDGGGVSPELLPRIFDPFFTTKEVGKGTGMGLSVVHGIVHGLGGHIGVETAPGAGLAMRLYMPPTEPADPTPRPDPSAPLPRVSAGAQRRHIMVVDDEPALQRLVVRALERAGFSVAVFSDGRSALAAFQAEPQAFDAILTDQTMPELTGRELLVAALRLRPDLPTILTTGFSDQIGPESAAQLGIRAFLEKPATLKQIVAAVQSLFPAG